MFMLYSLKVVGVMAATAVAELWHEGQTALVIASLPMFVTMGFATRQYARRRARERDTV